MKATLNITKESNKAGTPLTWHLHGQEKLDGKWTSHWDHVAKDVPVMPNKRFALHVHLREGNEEHGKVQVTLKNGTGKVWTIIDDNLITMHPDAREGGFNDINPIKLYTSGQLLKSLDEANKNLSYCGGMTLFLARLNSFIQPS